MILEVVLEHRCQLICLHSASYVLIYETLLPVRSVGTVAAHPEPVGAAGAVFNFGLLSGNFLLVVGFRGKLQIEKTRSFHSCSNVLNLNVCLFIGIDRSVIYQICSESVPIVLNDFINSFAHKKFAVVPWYRCSQMRVLRA